MRYISLAYFLTGPLFPHLKLDCKAHLMLNVITESLPTEIHPSLTGAASGWLELRLWSEPRRGQILRCRDTRCTIGSSSSCNVRVQAPGVAPIHCLIIRGHQFTVIRNFNPNSRLNGLHFEDAVLVAGDRLTLGVVELEVLTLDAGPPPQQRLRDALNDVNRLQLELETLEFAEQSHRETRARLQSQLESLDDELAELEIRASTSAAAHQEREEALLAQLRELEAERTEVQRQCAVAQQQLVQERQQREAHARTLSDLENRIREVETKLAVVQLERDELARELSLREVELAQQRGLQQQLATIRDQFTETQQRYEADRAQWESERQSFVDQLAALQSRTTAETHPSSEFQQLEQKLAAEVAARMTAVLAWESERRELVEQMEAAQAQIHNYMQQASDGMEQSADLRQRCAELEQRLADAQSEFEQKLESSRETGADSHELKEARERLEREFQSERHQWQSEREQLQSLVHELTERCQLSERRSSLESEPSDFNGSEPEDSPLQSAWHRHVDEPTAMPEIFGRMVLDEEVASVNEPFSDTEETYNPRENNNPVADESPSYGQYEDEQVMPVDSDTVLERLRRAGLLRREQRQEASDDSYETSPSYKEGSDPAEYPQTPELETESDTVEDALSLNLSTGSASPGEEDESSIQQYMDRLLRRVRGSESPRPSQAPKTFGKPAAQEVTSDEPAAAVEYVTAEQYIPRSSAPELAANLAAMRELANDSARSAITTYKRRIGTEGSRKLLTYSGVCFFGGLASLLLITHVSMIAGISGGVVGLGAAAVLAFISFAQAARLRSANDHKSA